MTKKKFLSYIHMQVAEEIKNKLIILFLTGNI